MGFIERDHDVGQGERDEDFPRQLLELVFSEPGVGESEPEDEERDEDRDLNHNQI